MRGLLRFEMTGDESVIQQRQFRRWIVGESAAGWAPEQCAVVLRHHPRRQLTGAGGRLIEWQLVEDILRHLIKPPLNMGDQQSITVTGQITKKMRQPSKAMTVPETKEPLLRAPEKNANVGEFPCFAVLAIAQEAEAVVVPLTANSANAMVET